MAQKTLILGTGEKGGAGKSTFLRGFLDLERNDGREIAAYDGDGSVGQLIQYYGERDESGHPISDQDPLSGVVPFDVRTEGDRDTLVNLLDTDAERVLIDLPGGVLPELGRVIDGRPASLAEEARAAGYRPVVVIVVTPMMASVRSVRQVVETFGDLCEYVVVKNGFYGNSDQFPLYDGYTDGHGNQIGGKGRAQLEEHGGITITMPPLQSRTYALLDLHNLRFADAVEDGRLPRADRSRVHRWRKQLRKEIEPTAERLGVTS
jgi:hypothetical protein